MDRALGETDQSSLKPWPAPSGGAERQLTYSRWEQRRRRPLRRREIIEYRVTFLLAVGYSGVVFALFPFSSLWCGAAKGGLVGGAISLIFSGPHQLAQLAGLRPPAAKAQ